MEIIFDIVLTCDETNSVHSMLRKKYDRDVVPVPGMKIEDPAWGEEAREPSEITLNYESQHCHLIKSHFLCKSALREVRLGSHRWLSFG